MIQTLAFLLMLQVAPTTYMADTSTTNKPQPAPPNWGPANSTINDPTFGTQILRVTDANTASGRSFVPTDAGNHATFNANNTRIKLTGPQGDGWWLEFNPSTFQVGTVPHSIPSSYGATWEWSRVNPDIIYVLHGNQIGTFNVTNGVTTDLGGPSDGSAVAYFANVVGKDNWVCAAAGPGQQDTWTRFFCLNVASPASSKYIDITNHTVNGSSISDPNWPTGSGPNGIHGMMGATGANWIELTLRNPSWCGNGDAIFNLSTNTWQRVKGSNNPCGSGGGGDIYWGGHTSTGQGIFANGAGNMAGNDSRGILLRDANNTSPSTYHFIGQPSAPYNGWCDAEHSSWLNSLTNPNAPIFQSRYISGCNYTWSDEILAIATDNSNTVYRFAHNYNGCPGSYYSQSFAQVSNDGKFVLFSSWWGGNLGGGSGFDCSSGRIDTFMLKLVTGDTPPAVPVLSFSQQPTNTIVGMTLTPNVAGTLLPAAQHSLTLSVNSGNCTLGGTTTVMSNASGAWTFASIPVMDSVVPDNCTLKVTDNTSGVVTPVISSGFNVTPAAVETITVSVNSGNCALQGTTTVPLSGGVTGTFAFPGLTVTATQTPPQVCSLKYHDSDGVTPDVVSDNFTVLGNAPTVPVLAITQQPSNTANGDMISPAISGTLTPGSVRTLTIGIDGSNCSLGGAPTTIQTASNGDWSFPGLTVSAVGLPAICWIHVRDMSTTNPAATVISTNFTVMDVPPEVTSRVLVPRRMVR